MTKFVVSNTTPLISLVGVGLLDVLLQLFGRIVIPTQVLQEYQAGAQSNDPDLTQLAWISIVPVSSLSELSHLGAGESATIALASQLSASLVLLDDHQARQAAIQRGLKVTGTVGVLLLAKQGGILDAVQPVLDTLIIQGRHISLRLRTDALRLAGEA